jgi:hypothetical protein
VTLPSAEAIKSTILSSAVLICTSDALITGIDVPRSNERAIERNFESE